MTIFINKLSLEERLKERIFEHEELLKLDKSKDFKRVQRAIIVEINEILNECSATPENSELSEQELELLKEAVKNLDWEINDEEITPRLKSILKKLESVGKL